MLSWTLLTAPIATRARLTLYYQLEKICGRKLVTLYNLANGVMFCFLAGAMVTVSATAFGVWFKFPMPGLNDLLPQQRRLGGRGRWWSGAMIAVVAAYGYKIVAAHRQHRRAVDGAGVHRVRHRLACGSS